MSTKTVCVVGLVSTFLSSIKTLTKNNLTSLILAKAFSKHLKVIGFDVDRAKISKLNDDDKNKYNLNIFLVNENIT